MSYEKTNTTCCSLRLSADDIIMRIVLKNCLRQAGSRHHIVILIFIRIQEGYIYSCR